MFGQHQSPNLKFGSRRFSGLEAGGDGSFSGDGGEVGRRAGGAGCCLQKSGLSSKLLRYLRFYRLFIFLRVSFMVQLKTNF